MKNYIKQSLAFVFLCLLISGCSKQEEVTQHEQLKEQKSTTEIQWDTYGVPHIYGTDDESVFYGFGWAQAKSQGDIILRLYGQARARGAEYWGAEYEDTDKWLLGNDVPARGKQWYEQQEPQFKKDLDAFAKGINDYANKYPETIDPEVLKVLPVSGEDVVTHAHRLMNFIYVASEARTVGDAAPKVKNGSNTYAVMPKKSKSGHTMLLQNPHLPWATGFFTYYEAHLSGPDFEMYGATQVGLPVIRFAFNQNMGISNTVNSMLGATTYQLRLKDGGYLFDGEVLPFDTVVKSYKVLEKDGSLVEKTLPVRHSVHGAVFERKDGETVALRVAGLDRPGMLKQYFDMLQARSFDEFTSIMKRLQIPTFNITYADKAGNIQYLDNGILPKRKSGDLDFWKGLVPGDSSDYLWTEIHSYEDLPKVINPEGGFVQNANDPPWIATYPPVYKPEDFPDYVAVKGPMSFRAQNAVRMMVEREKLSFEEFEEMKISTYALMADRVLDELLDAARTSDDPEVQQAVVLLSEWNRTFDAENRAGFLFEEWAVQFSGPRPRFLGKDNYRTAWTIDNPIDTPVGIKDPSDAVSMLKVAIAETKKKYGRIDPVFGDISRFRLDGVDLPGHGGYGNLGAFNVITWVDPDGDGIREPYHGETWVSMVEFSTPVKAKGMMAYGNSRQKGSKHYADQLEFLANDDYRTLWLQKAEIDAHTVETESISMK
ncbi:acylase [Alteromonas sp. 1_MG-2023]|uniref:acylase n=1 Tax=Alteromonas sp. 1_MG-2023 TaxID=3062669 RepID=UPI0026E21618|nr:acylase [Alteromonas sp. 1_MG-2023]MDO6477563.1 acylase [Alteromonas sp. 1_MG-2023]